MTKLEMNKEYTYPQICEILDWEVYSGGNSKKAQIKEIESAYKFYHPVNKKTHKQKKSYIFTKQLREPIEPSKSNCGGSHNLKNIRPMVEYMQGLLSDDYFGSYISMSDWDCEILRLLDKELCKTVYCGDDAIDFYCDKQRINNKKLLCEYVSIAKSVLKNIFLKSLNYMQKNKGAVFDDGYIFIYRLGKRKKTLGYTATNMLNDIIKDNETTICDDMNEEHNLSDKLKGRQNLLVIYNSKNLTEQFNELKLFMLMDNDEAMKILNNELELQHGEMCTPISKDNLLIAYYFGICIHDMELVDADIDALGKEICNIIRNKVRKTLFKKHYKNKWSGEIVYPYINEDYEILKIEKLLFKYFDEELIDNTCLILDDMELDELFDIPQMGNADEWEEQFDCSVEEILDMPILSAGSNEQYNILDSESHDKSNHELFCVTENDLDIIDIDDLF